MDEVTKDEDTAPWMDQEGSDRLRGLMQRMSEREPVHLDPEEYQLILRMQDRMRWLEQQNRKFLEKHDIVEVVRAEVKDILGTLSLDISSPKALAETSNRLSWLMGLKPGFKGAAYAVLGTIMTAAVGLIFSWIQSWKHP